VRTLSARRKICEELEFITSHALSAPFELMAAGLMADG
jgi:hypothetical protein